MKKWFNQFWCLHFWSKGEQIRAGWPWGVEYRYTCEICGKSVIMINDFPISGAPNPIYGKKDLRYNLSPPFIQLNGRDDE